MLLLNVNDNNLADVIAESLPAIYWLEATDTGGNSWNPVLIGTIPATSHGNGQDMHWHRSDPEESLKSYLPEEMVSITLKFRQIRVWVTGQSEDNGQCL